MNGRIVDELFMLVQSLVRHGKAAELCLKEKKRKAQWTNFKKFLNQT